VENAFLWMPVLTFDPKCQDSACWSAGQNLAGARNAPFRVEMYKWRLWKNNYLQLTNAIHLSSTFTLPTMKQKTT